MTENQAIVRSFIDAFNANDLEQIMGFFHAEAEWRDYFDMKQFQNQLPG